MAAPDPTDPAAPPGPNGPGMPVVVKKYANRRLYDTESSCYITLENLAQMVRQGRDFVVTDAKTGEDITRAVLTQIIVEEEGKAGRAMLPIPFLRQLIGFYGDSLQNVVPGYLEQSMAAFARQRQQMREAVQQTMGSFLPPTFEAVGRQNMAMLERAMSLFSPFYRPGETAPSSTELPAESPTEPFDPLPEDRHAALVAEVERLRAELEAARATAPPAASSKAARDRASKT